MRRQVPQLILLANLAVLAASIAACCTGEVGTAEQVTSASGAQETAAEALVIDGQLARREDFPAVCSFLNQHGVPDCTCVLVGPQAALTAQHCVDEGNRSIEIFGVGVLEGECTPAPQSDLDLAICRVDQVSGIEFENLGSSPPDTELVLTGFGCTKFLQNHPEGSLHNRSIDLAARPGDLSLITLDSPFLCGGDSGGPGYILLRRGGAFKERVKGPRLVVGINHSKTEITSVTTPAAREFISDWARDNNTQICGVTPGAQDCRPL